MYVCVYTIRVFLGKFILPVRQTKRVGQFRGNDNVTFGCFFIAKATTSVTWKLKIVRIFARVSSVRRFPARNRALFSSKLMRTNEILIENVAGICENKISPAFYHAPSEAASR